MQFLYFSFKGVANLCRDIIIDCCVYRIQGIPLCQTSTDSVPSPTHSVSVTQRCNLHIPRVQILRGTPFMACAIKSSFKTSLQISLQRSIILDSHISFDKNWFPVSDRRSLLSEFELSLDQRFRESRLHSCIIRLICKNHLNLQPNAVLRGLNLLLDSIKTRYSCHFLLKVINYCEYV